MSNSRLNSKKKYQDARITKKWILNNLLLVHGNSSFKILGWGKRLKGYGLRQTDFDNDEIVKVNTRKFKEHKKELLRKKLIKEIETKKGNYYSLTILGISQIFQNDKLSLAQYRRVMNILFQFIDKDEFENFLSYDRHSTDAVIKYERYLLNKLMKDINKIVLCDALRMALKGIKIDEWNNQLLVQVTYPLPNDSICSLYSFIFHNDKIYLKHDPAEIYKKLDEWKEKDFFDLVSTLILEAFHYTLRTKIKKNIPSYYKEQSLIRVDYFNGMLIDSISSNAQALNYDLNLMEYPRIEKIENKKIVLRT